MKEKYNNSFFQDQKCFREMSVLLENAILIKIERFNRELKIEIQLSPFAPDPSCEMLTDCAYPMGLLPSATTFFDLCAWYFLLAIPVWRFRNTKSQEAQTRSGHCSFSLSLTVPYVTGNLYNCYSLSVTHSLDWLILLVRLFSPVENTACFYPEPYLPFYLGSILASFYTGRRTHSICFSSCPYSNTAVQLPSLGYCYSHKQMSLNPTADAFRSFPFASCLVS